MVRNTLTVLSVLLSVRILLAGASPVSAVRTSQPPTIDGVIEEAEWAGAARFEDFIQLEPRRGAPETQRTVAYFFYDDTQLYFAVYCYDTEPETITARLNRRDDDLRQDDGVAIVLDTFHDRRTGYYFGTNPLGTQLDGRIKNDGRVVEDTWDAAWSSAARIVADGWTSEFAIPLRVLMFRTGQALTWGINIGRSRRSNLENTFWFGPLEDGFRISQHGELTGLDLARGGARRWELIPYVQGRWEQNRNVRGNAGLDLRYTVRPETAANITINPDFATIEADEEFVNLTRFEPELTEKRPFFLETNERFRQRIQTFYSRRIEDIDVGGKLASRNGPWDFTLLSARSPGVTNPSAGSGDDPASYANYTVGRAELQFLKASNVAFMASNRSLAGENRGSVGLDTTMHWTRKLNFTGQLVRAHGPYQTGNWGWFVRPAYDTNTGHAHIRFTHLGERFADNANAIGFIRDDDRREADSDLSKTFWFEEGALQRLNLLSKNNIYWSQRNLLRSYHNILNLGMEFRNRWSAGAGFTNDFKRYEKGFHNDVAHVWFGYNTREYNSFDFAYATGRNFDSDYRFFNFRMSRKITTKLSTEYRLRRVWLTPDPERKATVIHILRARQNFTRDLFLKVFYQSSSVIDRRNLEVVFVWRHKPPFGSLQFVFQRGRAAFGERSEQGNTYFIKLAHVF